MDRLDRSRRVKGHILTQTLGVAVVFVIVPVVVGGSVDSSFAILSWLVELIVW